MKLCRRTLLAIAAGVPMAGAYIPGRAMSGARNEPAERPDEERDLVLCLTGDVMSGRGIDQILPHPGDPRIFEPYVRSALDYLHFAERKHGPIPRPADFAHVWGDARERLAREAPDLRIVNLETAITADGLPEPKGINYRMHPANIGLLTAFSIDCCTLANNHLLDWGEEGLLDTLDALDGVGIRHAGAGRNAEEAAAPAVLEVAGKGRVLVFAYGFPSSGVPLEWAAGPDRPGVNVLDEPSPANLARITAHVQRFHRPGDLLVASLHWGGNWGYEVTPQERDFAHGLIAQAGFHLIHGHSSHHAKGIEIFEGRPILYGCGDFLNDYEGIEGYEAFRDDLAVAYLARFSAEGWRLRSLRLLPFRIRNFRLQRAPAEDIAWLRHTLDRESRRFATRVIPGENGDLRVEG